MKKLFLSLLFVMAVFALTSCDSLWEHENKEAVEISFTIPQEWLDSFVEEAEAVKQAQSASGGQSLQRASVDTSITAHVSIHDAEKGAVVAKQAVNLGNSINQTISLGPLYIVGSTVYAQVELTQYGHLSRIRKSDPLTVVNGMNTLTFDMGEAVLNITKMTAHFDDVSKILTVRPDPNSALGLKAAINAQVDVVGRDTVIEIEILPPEEGKIIPEADLSFLFSNSNFSGSKYTALTTITGLEHIYTGYVTYMNNMFGFARSLTSLDVSSWDTSSVTNMSAMFFDTLSLTSLDVSAWDTSSLTDMSWMFNQSGLTSLDLSAWDTSSVTSMGSMFQSAYSLNSLNVSGWDTSSVTTMEGMFYDAFTLKSIDVSSWDTSKVTTMKWMFYGAEALTSLDVSSWDTSSVTNMAAMFQGMDALTEIEGLNKLNTSSVKEMQSMFNDAIALTSLDVSSWDTSSVTNMNSMFNGANTLTSIKGLNNWDTSSVADMSHMFYEATALISLNVSGWDTSSVINMPTMFGSTTSLTNLNVSGWDTSNVIEMTYMFYGANTLTNLDLSSWDSSSAAVDNMFQDCTSVTTAYGRTQADCDRFNDSSNKPSSFTFVVK